jgi:hypothetical protein
MAPTSTKSVRKKAAPKKAAPKKAAPKKAAPKKAAPKKAAPKKAAPKKAAPKKPATRVTATQQAAPKPASSPSSPWEQLLKRRGVELSVVAAAVHEDHLYVAVDSVDNDDENAQAGALFAVDMNASPVRAQRLYEAAGSLKDYVCHEGAHLLLFRDALVTLRAGVASRVVIPLESDGEPAGPWGTEELRRVAPCGTGVLVTSETDDDGLVRFIDGDRVEVVLRCSAHYEASGLGALWCDGRHAVVVGEYGAYFSGAPRALATPLPEDAFDAPPDTPGRHSLLSVHQKADGTVLVGGRNMAAVVAGGAVSRIDDDLDGMYVHGVVEHDGVEVWAMRNYERIVLSHRDGLRLTRRHQMKSEPVRWRAVDPLPLRLCTSGDRLLVTEADRVHVGDGRSFTQLKLSVDAATPFRRIGAGLKPV